MSIKQLKGMINKQKIILVINFIVLTLASSFTLAQKKEWNEIKYSDEVIIIKDAKSNIEIGKPFARNEETTFIQIADHLGNTGKIAAAEIKKYLPLACGCRVTVVKENEVESKKKGFTIFLASTNSQELMNWTEFDYPKDLDEQECFIKHVKTFPNGTEGIALIGGSNRGLLNGVYTLLEKSADIWWEPTRILNPKYPLYSNISETILSKSNELLWKESDLRWSPVVKQRILYLSYTSLSKRSVDWASRNRLSHLVITTPHKLPMSREKEKLFKSIIEYAHARGLKVLFMNMTHRLPFDSSTLPASSDESLLASTKLYLDQFKRFGVDGMTWHAASEGIDVNMDAEYKKKSRIEWEAKYFNSYYNAIRKVNKDAELVMLMGWVYMNPAEKLAKLFPEDVIAWVVPNTPIIDAAVTDLESYDNYFTNIWYWLYVMVSRDSVFPMVKLDYLEKYFREAINRGHQLAPQGVLYNNNENAMYYAQSSRDGVIPNKKFLKSFGERYYGDSRMGEALIKYQEALKFHRNWFNNIHTVDINYYLTFEESDYLREAYKITIEAANEAKTPLIKDRLKILSITILRCLMRRSPSPDGYGNAWNSNLQKLYEKNIEEFFEMIKEIKSIFPNQYFGKEKDFFGNELLNMEESLQN